VSLWLIIFSRRKNMSYAPISSNNPQATENSATSRKLNSFYGIAVVGGLLMVVSLFLTWYNIKISGSLAQEFSVTGLGGTDSTASLAKTTAQAASSAGMLILFLGGIILVLSALGLWLNKKGFAITLIVFGVLAVGFTLLKAGQANDSNSLVSTSGAIGVYLAFGGAVLAFVGSIVSLIKTKK
jgi:hypothetical protein